MLAAEEKNLSRNDPSKGKLQAPRAKRTKHKVHVSDFDMKVRYFQEAHPSRSQIMLSSPDIDELSNDLAEPQEERARHKEWKPHKKSTRSKELSRTCTVRKSSTVTLQ